MSAVTVRHHSPASDAARDEPPRAEPIEREHARVHAEEHGKQDREVRDRPGEPVADLLDAALTDRALVLEHVLRDLRACFRGAHGRHVDVPADEPGLARVLDAARREHEAELGGPRLVGRARDCHPRLLINHLC